MDNTEKKYTLQELKEELNENQKKFCHRWIIDYNNVKSYMFAYPNTTYNSASASADNLLEITRIKQYIDFIKSNLEKEAGITKLKQLNTLFKIIDDKESNSRDILAAVAESNKMMGYHEPDKLVIKTPGKEIKLNFDE